MSPTRVGWKLRCLKCQADRRITNDEALRYLSEGWPRCHDQTMHLEDEYV